MDTETAGTVIAPAFRLCRALFKRADGVLPAMSKGHGLAFDIAAPRKTDMPGLQRGQHLCQILAEGQTAPRFFRHQRELIQPERFSRPYGQLTIRSRCGWTHLCVVSLPRIPVAGHARFSQPFSIA